MLGVRERHLGLNKSIIFSNFRVFGDFEDKRWRARAESRGFAENNRCFHGQNPIILGKTDTFPESGSQTGIKMTVLTFPGKHRKVVILVISVKTQKSGDFLTSYPEQFC